MGKAGKPLSYKGSNNWMPDEDALQTANDIDQGLAFTES